MYIPESSINEILENSPSQETLHLLLPLLKAEGKINLVIRECRKAVSRFPNDLYFKKILAETYMEEGQLLDAEEEAAKVIEGIKRLATAYKLQAEIYLRQGRNEDAALCLSHFLSFYPEDKDAAFKLKELGLQDEAPLPESGDKLMDSGIQELEQELPEIITATLAKVYFDQGKLDEAKEIYEKLAEMNPDDAVAASHFKEISALSDINDAQEETPPVNERRHKTEKIISVLDAWRKNISALSNSGTTAV
ncbi:MAG: tetratricopeptide repeat protein [Desulfatiglans sp.]|jgi:tetratricopeptide (TPR) repeat protein|nr:tetratricopeptide repeat protein [Desulfatiglans sp.]